MQRDAVVVGKRVARILQLRGYRGRLEARAMRREIEQGDFCSRRSGRHIGEEDRTYRLPSSLTFFLCREFVRASRPVKVFVARPDLENRVIARSAVGEYAALAMIDHANRHPASGRLPEQAGLWRSGCKLGVRRILQIGECDRRSRRKFGSLRRRRRIVFSLARRAILWRRARQAARST